MVLADRTNKHGGSSTNPPAASLNGERSIIATNPPIFYQRQFQTDRFWREADIRRSVGSETLRPRRVTKIAATRVDPPEVVSVELLGSS